MQDAKEEIRGRLNIEDIIGEYVQLKRAGRNWKGLSPFGNERTPSFVVSPDKQIWHDFSSNRGGDIFSFIMEMEGFEFREALEMLARRAGVDLGQFQKGDGTLAKRKARLLSVLDSAAHYYQHSLVQNTHAMEYVFKKRTFTKATVTTFRIGYAPQAERALRSYLTKKGFSEQELREAGLLNSRGGDMFRARMMVPLCDSQGQVVGFTARLIDDQPGAPKYINTPATLLYDKGRQLFGFHLAKEAIRKADYAVIVEGNLDVVSSHQAMVSEVVACAGTALTEMQLKQLSRLTHHVRIAFDGDDAGIAATERAIEIAQQVGVDLSVVSLPNGLKDPDEAIQQDPAIWQQAIANSQHCVDWLITQYSAKFDPATSTGKRAITSRALQVIKQLRDPVEQEHYMELLGEITGASNRALEQKMSQNGEEVSAPQLRMRKQSSEPIRKDRFAYQDSLLALAAAYPETRATLKGAISAGFSGEQRQRIASYLLSLENKSVPDNLPTSLQSDDTYVKILLLRAEERYGAWDSQDQYMEAAKLARDVANEQKLNRKKELIDELRIAEEHGDDEIALKLRNELNKLIKET